MPGPDLEVSAGLKSSLGKRDRANRRAGQRVHRQADRTLLVFNDDCACHMGMNCAEMLVLAGRLEFV